MQIRFSAPATRSLLRSNKRMLIRAKIDQLADDPASLDANVKQLRGRPEFRLRVQDWRVLFRREADTLWIDDIAPRGSVYED